MNKISLLILMSIVAQVCMCTKAAQKRLSAVPLKTLTRHRTHKTDLPTENKGSSFLSSTSQSSNANPARGAGQYYDSDVPVEDRRSHNTGSSNVCSSEIAQRNQQMSAANTESEKKAICDDYNKNSPCAGYKKLKGCSS